MKQKYLFVPALVAGLCNLASDAVANDGGLYADTPPADAAFVRVLADPVSSVSDVRFVSASLTYDDSWGRKYVAVSATELEGVKPGSFHSIVFDSAGETTVVKEPERGAPSKVSLILVNVSGGDVRLVAPEHESVVVPAVGHAKAGAQAVNPIKATFAVERVVDGVTIGSFDVQLTRGQNLSFVVGDGQVELIENQFGPVVSLR